MPSVLITGANRGLGLEFARAYRADGWEVVAACRRPAEAAALNGLGVETAALDVADPSSIEAAAKALSGRAFDVLLNNAGVYGEGQEFGRLNAAEWARVLGVNVIAPLKIAEAFLPHVLAGRKRIMAFMSSRMGSIGDNSAGGSYIYRSSKAALNAAVKSLSVDLKNQGVIAVVLHPGWVKTDMGGPSAPLDAPGSIAGLRRVIDGLGAADSGSFIDYAGARLPW